MKKERNGKNVIIMIMVIIVVALIAVGIVLLTLRNINRRNNIEENKEESQTEKYAYELEDGTKINNSNKLKETKRLDGLEIKDIQLVHQDGVSRIIGTVKNTRNEDRELTGIVITLYNDKGEELEKINGLISPVKANETVEMDVGISTDYANAYDLKIEIE